eukprot:scaffold122179_cov27-Tisochrysis_lutea.AAC.3
MQEPSVICGLIWARGCVDSRQGNLRRTYSTLAAFVPTALASYDSVGENSGREESKPFLACPLGCANSRRAVER